jgi:uncharacterized membrane protein YbhN (UPF0104 family)
VVSAVAVVVSRVGPDAIRLVERAWVRTIQIPPSFLVLACALMAVNALLITVTWWNILRATFPRQHLTFRFVFGAHQGQSALAVFAPTGTANLAMFGLFRLTIPEARVATLLATWAVQSLAFSLLAAANYVILILTRPDAVESGSTALGHLERPLAEQRALVWAVVCAALVAGGVLIAVIRRRLTELQRQIALGGAILSSPSRYLLQVFVPSLLSNACRWAISGVLMAAFGIPVSPSTVALVVASHTIAGSIRVTPAGLGTVQALDVVLLSGYASAEAVTAYSLSQSAISAVFNVAFGLSAMTWVFGWTQTRHWVRRAQELAATSRAAAAAERIAANDSASAD